jgi:folate-binding protein YgfZ
MVLETPQNFVYDRGEVNLLVISGPDTNDFLNRLSTRNFKKELSESLHGAFLNGQAKVISIFTAWQFQQKIYFFIEKDMFQKTKDYLEKMHFAEDLKIETEKYFCIESRGDKSFPSEIQVEAYNWGIAGKYCFSKRKFEVEGITDTQYDAARANFGFPKPQRDLTVEHILIEGPMDDFVDRNKGCYPGQEVIEKIYTYGRVARKIKKIIFENSDPSTIEKLKGSLPQEIEFEGKNIGVLTSVYNFKNSIGLVTLKRHFYEKHQSFSVSVGEDAILKASVMETGPIT